jgi:SAM-dependent methyltransferase
VSPQPPTPFDGASYQASFDALAAACVDVHGEAAFVLALHPASVLDAGCGTGRVAIELARHSVAVTGVDVDASMIAEARRRAPGLDWRHADLAALALGHTFDLVVLAGNVPLFTPPGTEHGLVTACAAHVAPGGQLVAGFQLGHGYVLDDYDASASSAGLTLEDRFGTWGREPFTAGGDYAVSVHRR